MRGAAPGPFDRGALGLEGAGVEPADLDRLAALVQERLAGAALTPGEVAEALCIALGVGCELSAAARGVSARTVKARRLRLRRKLEQAAAE